VKCKIGVSSDPLVFFVVGTFDSIDKFDIVGSSLEHDATQRIRLIAAENVVFFMLFKLLFMKLF